RRWSDRAPSIPQLEEEAAAEEPAELLEDQVHERVVEEELSQIDAERTEVSRSQLQLPAGWRRRPATTPQFNWSQEAALVNDAPRRESDPRTLHQVVAEMCTKDLAEWSVLAEWAVCENWATGILFDSSP
ncbi:unnamed protein product, partial [Effrenium voratum]